MKARAHFRLIQSLVAGRRCVGRTRDCRTLSAVHSSGLGPTIVTEAGSSPRLTRAWLGCGGTLSPRPRLGLLKRRGQNVRVTTVKYLGIEVDDAIAIAEQVDV